MTPAVRSQTVQRRSGGRRRSPSSGPRAWRRGSPRPTLPSIDGDNSSSRRGRRCSNCRSRQRRRRRRRRDADRSCRARVHINSPGRHLVMKCPRHLRLIPTTLPHMRVREEDLLHPNHAHHPPFLMEATYQGIRGIYSQKPQKRLGNLQKTWVFIHFSIHSLCIENLVKTLQNE